MRRARSFSLACRLTMTGRARLLPDVAWLEIGADHPLLRGDHRAGTSARSSHRAPAQSRWHGCGPLTDHLVDRHLDREGTALGLRPRHPPSFPERPIPSEHGSVLQNSCERSSFVPAFGGTTPMRWTSSSRRWGRGRGTARKLRSSPTGPGARSGRPPTERLRSDDSIRRTLVLAQRTADLAIREAQEQAAVLMDTAQASPKSCWLTHAGKLSASAQKPSAGMPTTCPGSIASGPWSQASCGTWPSCSRPSARG